MIKREELFSQLPLKSYLVDILLAQGLLREAEIRQDAVVHSISTTKSKLQPCLNQTLCVCLLHSAVNSKCARAQWLAQKLLVGG